MHHGGARQAAAFLSRQTSTPPAMDGFTYSTACASPMNHAPRTCITLTRDVLRVNLDSHSTNHPPPPLIYPPSPATTSPTRYPCSSPPSTPPYSSAASRSPQAQVAAPSSHPDPQSVCFPSASPRSPPASPQTRCSPSPGAPLAQVQPSTSASASLSASRRPRFPRPRCRPQSPWRRRPARLSRSSPCRALPRGCASPPPLWPARHGSRLRTS